MRLIIILAVLLPAVAGCSLKFGPLCSGNPTNRKRGCDGYGWGCGHYGARRTHGRHKGLDIVCNDGATVYAPFDLKLDGPAAAYRNPTALQKLINDGVRFSGEGLCVKLFYVKVSEVQRRQVQRFIEEGTKDRQTASHRRITSHTHVQMCDESNPTNYF